MREKHGRSWKVMESCRMFGLCDQLSSCMTWRCLETSGIFSFSLVLAHQFVNIRAHRPQTWKNNANYFVYSNKTLTQPTIKDDERTGASGCRDHVGRKSFGIVSNQEGVQSRRICLSQDGRDKGRKD